MSTRAFTVQAASGRARREATQARIVEAFRELLEAGEPVAAMSVDRICEAAGVSRSTFYAHFPDKRELITRLVDEDSAPWTLYVAPVLADPSAGRDAIEEAVRALVANWHDHARVGAAIIELAEYDSAARDAWRSIVDGIAATVADHLRLRWGPRAPAGADPDLVAQTLAWMVERSCHTMLVDDDPEADARVVSALTAVIWSVLSAPSSGEG